MPTKKQLKARIKELEGQVRTLAMAPDSIEASLIRVGIKVEMRLEESIWTGSVDDKNKYVGFEGIIPWVLKQENISNGPDTRCKK